MLLLFDCEFPGLSVPTHGLVDSAISPAANEAHDPVSVQDTDFAFVDAWRHLYRINRL